MSAVPEYPDPVSTQVDVAPVEVAPGQFDQLHDPEQRLFARPTYKRTDTSPTVTVPENYRTDIKGDDYDLEQADTFTSPAHVAPLPELVLQEMTYPPAAAAIAQDIPAVELNGETKFKRRLRMFASFIAFFLAGWK